MTQPISKVVILTALGLERKAILTHLDGSTEREHGGTIYEVGVLPCAEELEVAVAEIGAGNVSAAIHVERAKQVLDPDLIAFVGVAGGVKDVSHGDVVVAQKVYGYESGKADEMFLPRPEAFPLGHRIEQHTMRVIGSDDWHRRLPEAQRSDLPKALLGPIAAGDALVRSTDSEIYRRLQEHFSDTLAVEMEGRGLFIGAHMNDSLPAVVIRGISDLIDDKSGESDKHWQPIAAANAAAFAVELLCRLSGQPTPIEVGTHTALAAITESLSSAYYLNVPRLLADPSALALLTTWGPEELRRMESWSALGFAQRLQLLQACETAIKNWTGAALSLEAAIDGNEVGSRVVFDRSFRTRNWGEFDPEIGLTGNLEVDPLVYTDVGGRRVYMPIDPCWATTSTGQAAFTQGCISFSGVALLRNVAEETALASPYVLAPPVAAQEFMAALSGR